MLHENHDDYDIYKIAWRSGFGGILSIFCLIQYDTQLIYRYSHCWFKHES
jgi:hypothetical protein